MSFGQNELSTYVGNAVAYGGYAPSSQLNYADFGYNCSQTYSVDQSGMSSYVGDKCLPWLVPPSQVVHIDSAWATCTGMIGGFYDPPFAITSAKGLGFDPTPPSPASSPTAVPENTGNTISKATPAPSQDPDPPSQPLKSATVFNPQPASTPGNPSGPNPSTFQPPVADPTRTSNVLAPSPTLIEPALSSMNIPVGNPVIDPVPPSTAPFSNPAAVVISESTIIEGSAPIVAEGTTTTMMGGSPTVVGGVTVVLSSGILHVGSSTAAIPTQQPVFPAQSTPIVIGGLTFSAAPSIVTPLAVLTPVVIGGATVSVLPSNSAVVIGTQTIFSGSKAATISGTPVSLGPSGLVVGNAANSAQIKTIALSQSSAAATLAETLNIGGQIITAGTGFAIGSQTLTPGGSGIMVSGTPVSLAIGGTLIVGTSTVALPASAAPSEILTVAGQTITAAATGFQMAGTTFTPGAEITISGTPISLAIGGTLIVGTSTLALPTVSVAGTSKVFTVAGETITAAATGIAVAGTTLTPGAAGITVSGTPVSLGVGGTLVIGSSTSSYRARQPLWDWGV
ncbi:hypothetical protein MMC13_004770 [Lambiella insularis]|nr:hypothetical protein [Lambiella insularis]